MSEQDKIEKAINDWLEEDYSRNSHRLEYVPIILERNLRKYCAENNISTDTSLIKQIVHGFIDRKVVGEFAEKTEKRLKEIKDEIKDSPEVSGMISYLKHEVKK